MRTIFFLIFIGLLIQGCDPTTSSSPVLPEKKNLPDKFIVVLGVAQDAGYPQIGCEKECCKAVWEGKEEKKHATCLALVERKEGKYWLFEATPDIREQFKTLQFYISTAPDYAPDGIFLTHAHIGHYTGLMQFGREAMGSSNIPVWAMPRMDSFLRNNGPWSQLVNLENISLQHLHADSTVEISRGLSVTPVQVPHRDEYSETVGFKIRSANKNILFIPDIDKWQKWKWDIREEVKNFDKVLIDGSFFRNGELPGRDMSEIPHPFVEETMKLLSGLPDSLKQRFTFIHFNHTNPLLRKNSPEKEEVKKAGYNIAEERMLIEL